MRDAAVAALVAALGAVAYLVADPPSADLATQAFRADLFEREGFTVFSTAWYGGHHTPGYSVLFPPLAAALGAQAAGALAAVAATGTLGALAGRVAALLAIPALLASLVSGRLTFVLGAAFGIAGVLAAKRGQVALAALGGALTALASPVAALFAALAGAALVVSGAGKRRAEREHPSAEEPERRAGLALAAGAAVVLVALVVAFPEGGTFPFAFSAFLPAFVAGVVVAVAAPPGPLRVGAALYALLCLAALVIPSPVGGNATRLGTLLVAPVTVALLWPRRRVALVLLALPIAYWVVQPAVRDWRRAGGDRSTEAPFYAPVTDLLRARGELRRVRIEVPFTQNHGEARHLAREVALARGWNRQLDRERNALFYDDGPLDAARYERWLHANAIAYVAVPLGVSLDASGEAERALVEGRPPFLREIAPGRLAPWRVFAVRRARPLATGAGVLVRLDPTGFVVRARRAGTIRVRVRHTPYWALASGRGCVAPAPGGWTLVRAEAPGRIAVRTRFALGRVRASSPRCR